MKAAPVLTLLLSAAWVQAFAQAAAPGSAAPARPTPPITAWPPYSKTRDSHTSTCLHSMPGTVSAKCANRRFRRRCSGCGGGIGRRN